MAKFKLRKKTSRTSRSRGRLGRNRGDFQKLNIHVSSPRIFMFQFLSGLNGILRSLLLLALITLIGWAAYSGVKRLFLENEKYTLQEIDLDTNGSLSHARIVDVAEIDLGASVFAIDLEAVKKRLSELPEVTSCDVERRLPGKLRIVLTERVPVAWIESPAHQFLGKSKTGILTDAQGITFPCEGRVWESAQHLPVISIYDAAPDTFEHGQKVKQTEIMRALHLIKNLQAENIRTQWQPKNITLVNNYAMELTCEDDSRATFGMYDHERQISDFISIHEHSIKTGRRARHLNLIPKINIPVKFSDEQPVLVTPKKAPQLESSTNNQEEREIQSILGRN